MNYATTALIPLLPLAGFVLLGLFGRTFFRNSSGIIACLLLFVSTILSLQTVYEYFFVSGKSDGVYQTIIPVNYPWLTFSDTLSINMGITLDPISVMMLFVVTFVSLMVHVYSLSYMKGEERFSTFFAFLQLFTFSMLGLVMASNIFQIYVFWELVGVSSYLLIGYYYDRPSAVAASKKAFVVTRFADLGFLIGILVLAFYAQTLDFNTLIGRLAAENSAYVTDIASASFMGLSALTWGAVLVFAGAAGKSAMFPLHIWLPDAMEGPTPVSALIHAATMVVAGVYLVARLFPIYAIQCPGALDLVAAVGIASAMMAAIIACTQTDIKRVLAYSTMSQIGYMMVALGVSGWRPDENLGYTASMFHLFTHAFFKSLLFLAAGVVIHYAHSNEMQDMGGLRKKLPVTHITFLIACLAIAGIPPFSGFFSKEEILHAAHQSAPFIYWLALITAGVTAFYMFRLYFSVFWNSPAGRHSGLDSESAVLGEGKLKQGQHDHDREKHREGSLSLLLPLIILAVFSTVAGFVPFSHFVTNNGVPFDTEFSVGFSVLPVAVGVIGMAVAFILYQKQNDRAQKIAGALGGFYRAAYRKFYIDELYLFITKKIVFNLVGRPAAWFDRTVVDGTMNGIARTTGKVSVAIKGIQSGRVQSYAIWFFGGVFCLTVLFIYLLK
jgi:NADH-quinone oxidoreductase subunit L